MDTKQARNTLRQMANTFAAAKNLEEALRYQEQCEGRVRELEAMADTLAEKIRTHNEDLARLKEAIREQEDRAAAHVRELERRYREREAALKEKLEDREKDIAARTMGLEQGLNARKAATEKKLRELEQCEREAARRADSAERRLARIRKEVGANG